MNLEMTIDAPGMTIAASLDGDRVIRDGDRCIPDGDHVSRDGYHCIPGWRSMHLGMASWDGDRCTLGWRLQHSWMAIVSS